MKAAGLRRALADGKAVGARLCRGAAAHSARSSASATSCSEQLLAEPPAAVHRRRCAGFQLRPRACAARRGHSDRALRLPVDLGVARRAHQEDRQGRRLTCCACSRSKTALLEKAGVPATYVGHPLADEIPIEPDDGAARAASSACRKAAPVDRRAAGQPALGNLADRPDVLRRNGTACAARARRALRDAGGERRRCANCCSRSSPRTPAPESHDHRRPARRPR